MDGCTDGVWLQNGARYFDCPPNKGYFCLLEQLVPDERFMASSKDLNARKLWVCMGVAALFIYFDCNT